MIGSARVSRVGVGVLAVADLPSRTCIVRANPGSNERSSESPFRRDAETSTRDAPLSKSVAANKRSNGLTNHKSHGRTNVLSHARVALPLDLCHLAIHDVHFEWSLAPD